MALQVRGKKVISDFGVNCPFKLSWCGYRPKHKRPTIIKILIFFFGFGVMVQDVVAILDGQSSGCALIGSYTSLHACVHHKGAEQGSFTYS